jgi:DNA modification methylase
MSEEVRSTEYGVRGAEPELPAVDGLEPYASGRGWAIYHGDNRAILPRLPAQCAHACITDPPYGLKFMGRRWDYSVGSVEQWQAVLRCLLPGAQCAAFGGSRTYHRAAAAIEDAGLELRDMVMWLYGSGFPKSLDVSKAIDKAAGAEREVVGVRRGHENFVGRVDKWSAGARGDGWDRPWKADPEKVLAHHLQTAPATPEAQRWHGWGTALKPAHEPICLARAPLDGTVAANVLAHGCGGINVDAGRVALFHGESPGDFRRVDGLNARPRSGVVYAQDPYTKERFHRATESGNPAGRWPANVAHDGSDEVLDGMPQTASHDGADTGGTRPETKGGNTYLQGVVGTRPAGRGDQGSAARFFYCAKASKAERRGSRHPTVKPLALMRWLVRMLCPPDGLILDPWGGTGTTAAAAMAEGMRCILIDDDADACADAANRLRAAESEPT